MTFLLLKMNLFVLKRHLIVWALKPLKVVDRFSSFFSSAQQFLFSAPFNHFFSTSSNPPNGRGSERRHLESKRVEQLSRWRRERRSEPNVIAFFRAHYFDGDAISQRGRSRQTFVLPSQSNFLPVKLYRADELPDLHANTWLFWNILSESCALVYSTRA